MPEKLLEEEWQTRLWRTQNSSNRWCHSSGCQNASLVAFNVNLDTDNIEIANKKSLKLFADPLEDGNTARVLVSCLKIVILLKYL